MLLKEFEIIANYFHRAPIKALLGGGDDCAVWQITKGMSLAVSSDMLVEGRHFLSTTPAFGLGHKALAVNLSDLAACGARPAAFTLALSLPRIDHAFLEGFSKGLFAIADAYQCELIGGDTTHGPLNICITVLGEVDPSCVIKRSGAQVGDDLYVSGHLGDARLCLDIFRGKATAPGEAFMRLRQALEQPTPRVELGLALRNVASSAIDLSDGLLGDLQHVLRASHVGATLFVDQVPVSPFLSQQPLNIQRTCALVGGDDYELLFTAPKAQAARVVQLAHNTQTCITHIGVIEAHPGLRLVDTAGRQMTDSFQHFDHFS
jgi:thiamine-monophosphate kinase